MNANKITNKIKYSSVNKLIIISHGSADSLQFDPNSLSVSSSNINGSVNPPCKIKLIDIQACNCGRAVFDNDFGYYTCIAYELVKKTNIEKVYAAGDVAGVKSTVAWASFSGREAARNIYEDLKQ